MFQREFTRITDIDEITKFVSTYNFGTLISSNPMKITHLPFLFDRRDDNEGMGLIASSHMARANDHWEHAKDQEVVIVITGPHGYISPRNYSKPNVPTWNYTAVHFYGQFRLVKDQHIHQNNLHRLVDTYEKDPEDWHFDMLDENQVKAQYNRSVSFKVDITRIEAKYKLSQNKPLEDRKQIIKHLKEVGNIKLAEFMEKHVI